MGIDTALRKEALVIQGISQLANLPEMPFIQVLTVSRAKAKLKPAQTSRESDTIVFFGEAKSGKQGVLNEKR
jgi:hypothetical protein